MRQLPSLKALRLPHRIKFRRYYRKAYLTFEGYAINLALSVWVILGFP